jgi:type IV pilus assembly protein PilA
LTAAPQTFLFAVCPVSDSSDGEGNMFEKMRKRMSSEGGFTLIELLVVIIIIAILAAIAIPTFLGQRQKAQDASAKSLVRNAMTAVESQFVDSQAYAAATVVVSAHAIEPSITFNNGGTINATTLTVTATSTASQRTVDYVGGTSTYGIGTMSVSGNSFGVYTDKSVGTYYLKKIGGTTTAAQSGW